MRVTVNGQVVELPEALTLRQLIERVGLASGPCAAELNRALIARRDHDATTLKEGDRVELVSLVGGG